MSSMIAVIEHHCVRNKLIVEKTEKVVCLINQNPKEAFYDKASLIEIANTTKNFNEKVLENKAPRYDISFKEIRNDDNSVFENLCNSVLNGEPVVETLDNIKAFTVWYKNHLKKNVYKDVKREETMDQYIKKPLK